MIKKWLEIGISTGLVLLMTVLLLAVQLAFPAELRSQGFVLVVLLFMVSMGFAGIKLMDVR
ncbi:MAG: hypothetical protein HPY61_06510 [Methanotrichaceae archaeon]|nr:hypothetical protein [Methanotrichaceae archaeon]